MLALAWAQGGSVVSEAEHLGLVSPLASQNLAHTVSCCTYNTGGYETSPSSQPNSQKFPRDDDCLVELSPPRDALHTSSLHSSYSSMIL